jgi:adhesin transport system membrane fusion protein
MTGTVKRIKVTTIGGVIQPGMDLMEIVPLEDKLLIEARVKPSDIAFLRAGQDGTVKLTAYDFSIYGGVPAKLEFISADSITNDEGETFYIIRVRTKTNYLVQGDKRLPIMPGMLATVDIRTGKKSVLSYLLKPVIKAREGALHER